MSRRHSLLCASGVCAAVALALSGLWLAGPAAAQSVRRATPVATFEDLNRALKACWRPPSDSPGSVITFRFGLDVQGRLKGKPLVTYSRLTGDGLAQRRFFAAALTALDACTPVLLEPQFAPIAANRVLTLTFASPAPTRDTPI